MYKYTDLEKQLIQSDLSIPSIEKLYVDHVQKLIKNTESYKLPVFIQKYYGNIKMEEFDLDSATDAIMCYMFSFEHEEHVWNHFLKKLTENKSYGVSFFEEDGVIANEQDLDPTNIEKIGKLQYDAGVNHEDNIGVIRSQQASKPAFEITMDSAVMTFSEGDEAIIFSRGGSYVYWITTNTAFCDIQQLADTYNLQITDFQLHLKEKSIFIERKPDSV
ncbi:hypothetical protein [Domibacillus epiphyticus]|uniref:Uncharacterized protein n=1 Tax=Domibacillus epiphyticus TaxID=1714355 RepID=A0A1V2AA55_9BACI|nr:hypothetical protein [Domibacillus epiphyticus]OMP67879.1 hypothetical protein BTO28_05170 [Domibacillus epiphyticus]